MTLGAALVFGAHGIIAARRVPEFIVVVVVARVLDSVFRKNGLDALWLLLGLEVLLLIGFFVSAVMLGPFLDSDAPAALFVGFTGIAAMQFRTQSSASTCLDPANDDHDSEYDASGS